MGGGWIFGQGELTVGQMSSENPNIPTVNEGCVYTCTFFNFQELPQLADSI